MVSIIGFNINWRETHLKVILSVISWGAGDMKKIKERVTCNNTVIGVGALLKIKQLHLIFEDKT